jgi:hypothetical protein
MASTRLRDENSMEGKAIWKDVELAASRAPEWIKERATQVATAPKEPSGASGGGSEARAPRSQP